jgi:cytochrome P450
VVLTDELANTPLADRDTTANLSSTIIHALASHTVWRKLRAEVEELKGRKPGFKELRQIKYLRYILNECRCPSREALEQGAN